MSSTSRVPPPLRCAVAAADVLTLLVGQALDDIDAGRFDVEAALRMVAEIAWKHGYDQAMGS